MRRAHGKLLLTGEYAVLDGVPALAVPTRPGQRMQVTNTSFDLKADLRWIARNWAGKPWLDVRLTRTEWIGFKGMVNAPRDRLLQLLAAAEFIDPGVTNFARPALIETELEFDRAWGLGSSSTLVYLLAEYLGINAYELLKRSFGGSGYDLACAGAKGPIVYERNETTPRVKPLDWSPTWASNSHFVYLNRKQNSRKGISKYRERPADKGLLDEVATLTAALVNTPAPADAQRIITRHEAAVSRLIGLPPMQKVYFPDFPGTIKSLGAWGGDFVWAVSQEAPTRVIQYFKDKGFGTVVPYQKMVR